MRSSFLVLVLGLLALPGFGTAPQPPVAEDVSLRALVSRADLHYAEPVARSEEGMPIGNGRTGSLVWTTPSAVRLQINRVDVQPINRETTSFFERHTDYMGGCGFVDVELAAAGPDAFPSGGTTQHLSVYDGLMRMDGRGVSLRLLAWHARDVIAIEIEDRRDEPEPIQVNLRMLRPAVVRTRQHTAASQIRADGNSILLTQEFREGSHVAKSAVAIAIAGREAAPRFADESEIRLVAPAARGRTVVLIASAATLDGDEDVAAKALAEAEAAARSTFDGVAADTAAWWHAFWSRGALALHSPDGIADEVAGHYHYYLYLMAATSRGTYPPKFNGMIWNTAGDQRTWGTQHWFANLSCYYEALFAANRLELLDPMFSMYSGMFDAAALAAAQQWGSRGIFIPETVWFDGLERLPEDIGAEMRDLYLLRKPWSGRSARFRAFAEAKHGHSSRWNWWGGGQWVGARWVPTERPTSPFGPVTHILGTTAKVAYLYWRRYEFTHDEEWLRARAWPMLEGAAEFYRHFPNVRKGGDGRYHIAHVNSNESVLGAHDTDEDLSAMRGILAAAMRASEILDIRADLRAAWGEMLDNLAPLPTSAHPEALRPADYSGPPVFVRGLKPTANDNTGFTPDGNSLPMWFFDLVNLDAPPEQRALAGNTFDRAFRNGIDSTTQVGVLSKWAIAGATLGRVEATRFLILNQIRSLAAERPAAYKGGRPLANRLALREGPQALDAQRLGRAAEALQLALLQSAPGTPAGDPVIHLFPAWPDEWDARFTLRARGAFVVTAERKQGATTFVELRSEAGGTCRLRNPWPSAPVTIARNGKRWRDASGPLLIVETAPGDLIRVSR